ncbi:hypothetical protein [Sulfurihydrogenibium sp.]|uniref:hypothetical protein n=1 Tax=Sulfurihydrogenibium sp. TaxID=2053621 RepID=UPI00260FBEBB|nr:hypothetical protein [Sulfurihydrogenibium sp.]
MFINQEDCRYSKCNEPIQLKVKNVFYKIVLFTIFLSCFVNIFYYFLSLYFPSSELDLTFIGLIGLLIFIPFLVYKPKYIKNCFSTVIFLGLLLYLPMIVIKFDIINLLVILLYINFINYIICNKGRREIEKGS